MCSLPRLAITEHNLHDVAELQLHASVDEREVRIEDVSQLGVPGHRYREVLAAPGDVERVDGPTEPKVVREERAIGWCI